MKIQNGSDRVDIGEDEMIGEGKMPNHIQNGEWEGRPRGVAETSSPGTPNIYECGPETWKQNPGPEFQPQWTYSNTNYSEKKYPKGDPHAGKGSM